MRARFHLVHGHHLVTPADDDLRSAAIQKFVGDKLDSTAAELVRTAARLGPPPRQRHGRPRHMDMGGARAWHRHARDGRRRATAAPLRRPPITQV